jgi:hypothetical protein
MWSGVSRPVNTPPLGAEGQLPLPSPCSATRVAEVIRQQMSTCWLGQALVPAGVETYARVRFGRRLSLVTRSRRLRAVARTVG